MYTYLKPEPVRVHPEATVRSAVYCRVTGNALSFASALGYRYVLSTRRRVLTQLQRGRQRHQYYKRGYLFRRGKLDIQMTQEERVRFTNGTENDIFL